MPASLIGRVCVWRGRWEVLHSVFPRDRLALWLQGRKEGSVSPLVREGILRCLLDNTSLARFPPSASPLVHVATKLPVLDRFLSRVSFSLRMSLLSVPVFSPNCEMLLSS